MFSPVAPPNFNLALKGTGSQTVVPGTSAGYTLQVSPIGGAYPGPVSFKASGLPAGATATFSPATIAANGGAQTVTMTATGGTVVKTVAVTLNVE